MCELKPIHVTRFVDKHGWTETTERNARRSVYRAFSWAQEEGIIADNPLKGMKCPKARTRERALTDDEYVILMRKSRRDFKRLLFALKHTGCRPKEARTLTWDQVREDRWVLREAQDGVQGGKASDHLPQQADAAADENAAGADRLRTTSSSTPAASVDGERDPLPDQSAQGED